MKRDMLQECNDRGESPQVFQKVFCRVCRNKACTNSRWGDSQWVSRMDTQVERIFGERDIVTSSDPRFSFLTDFKDTLREALALEVSSRTQDWQVPALFQGNVPEHLRAQKQEIPDPVEVKESSTQSQAIVSEEPQQASGAEVTPEEPTVVQQKPISSYRSMNTPMPSEGVMLDGTAAKPAVPSQQTAAVDPWAAPKKVENLVKVGATVKLGSRK